MASETVGNLKEVIDFVLEMKDRSVTSLTEYTKKTLISSRAYIEDSIVREDGMLPIMKFVNHLLGGFVFTAVGLSNLVAGGRTVRDMAAMISTEDFHQFLDRSCVDIDPADFGGTAAALSIRSKGVLPTDRAAGDSRTVHVCRGKNSSLRFSVFAILPELFRFSDCRYPDLPGVLQFHSEIEEGGVRIFVEASCGFYCVPDPAALREGVNSLFFHCSADMNRQCSPAVIFLLPSGI